MIDIKSAQYLLRALNRLEVSLQKPYETYPDRAETDFLNAVSDVAFLSRVVFDDLVSRQGADISTNWALNAAIELGEFEASNRLLKAEILEIQQENGDLEELTDMVASKLKNAKRSERWNALLTSIESAKAA